MHGPRDAHGGAADTLREIARMADDQRHDDQRPPDEAPDRTPDPTPPSRDAPGPEEALDAASRAVDGVDPAIDEDDLARAKASLDEAAAVAGGAADPPDTGAPAGEQERPVTFDLPPFDEGATPPDAKGIDLLSDVNLNVTIELGRTRMLVEDVLKLAEGAVVELDKLAGDPVDVYVNDRLIARGEVLVLNDTFCIRVNEIIKQGADAVAEAG
jgi:flagellar motor switch protein FliN/FliY